MVVMMKKSAIITAGDSAAAGAVAGPMAYFQYFDRGNSPSPATSSQDARAGAQRRPRATAAASAAGKGLRRRNDGQHRRSRSAGHASHCEFKRAHARCRRRVFDFQITPESIVAHWPAVSTGLAQLQLEGYRVPLVTGTAKHNLAGSLTWYFNAQQKLQQITFVGRKQEIPGR